MVWSYAKQLLDKLSVRAITQRFDKRRLQQEIDTHRLYLLLGFHQRHDAAGGALSSEQIGEELAAAVEKQTHEERVAAVQQRLTAQLHHISSALDRLLLEAGNSRQAAVELQQLFRERQQAQAAPAAQAGPAHQEQRRRSGLAAATGGGAASRQELQPAADSRREPDAQPAASGQQPECRQLSMQEISQRLQEALGYSLELRPSLQNAGKAGTGLWLRGSAPLGCVVALYPGPVYQPTAYRKIPGYPKVDRGNDCLIARLDGAVIDAKPWGRGAEQLAEPAAAKPLRHPLALAHFANHPSRGSEPNVVVAAFDWWPPKGCDAATAAALRAYVPNASVSLESEFVGVRDPAGEGVPGLALVASRPLADEELLLNYRLSTHVARPDWYHPVDEEEDRRRWA